MQITWYGKSCFKIVSGDLTIVLGPFDAQDGLRSPRSKVDILLLSGNDVSEKTLQSVGSGFVVSGAGEYEIRNVLIRSFSFFSETENEQGNNAVTFIVHLLRVEGVSICYLGNANKAQIESVLEEFGGIDILILPVDGHMQCKEVKTCTLDVEEAAAITSEIEPHIIIPTYEKASASSLDKFLKVMGSHNVESVEKFSIKKKDIAKDKQEIVVFSTA